MTTTLAIPYVRLACDDQVLVTEKFLTLAGRICGISAYLSGIQVEELPEPVKNALLDSVLDWADEFMGRAA
jgi:hypothetical protein